MMIDAPLVVPNVPRTLSKVLRPLFCIGLRECCPNGCNFGLLCKVNLLQEQSKKCKPIRGRDNKQM